MPIQRRPAAIRIVRWVGAIAALPFFAGRAFYRAYPIVNRELVMFLRRTRAFVLLLVYLGLIFYFTLQMSGPYMSGGPRGYQAIFSRRLFTQSAVYQIALFGILAAFMTSRAISTERLRKTLDVLRTAPIRAHEIVVGKALASVGYLVILALAAIPMYSICFLLGGVGWTEIALMVYLTLLTIITYSMIGVAMSSSPRVKPTGEGGGGGVAILLLINGAIPVAAGLTANTVFKLSPGRSEQVAEIAFVAVCPPATFMAMLEGAAWGAGALSWLRWIVLAGHTLFQLGIFLFFLWLSCRAVRTEAVQAAPHTEPQPKAQKRLRLAFLRLFPIHDFMNPVAAKDLLLALPKRKIDRYAMGLLAVALLAFGAYAVAQSRSFPGKPETAFCLGGLAILFLVSLAAFLRASGVVVSEVDANTNELLAATSLRPGHVVRGKLLAVVVGVVGATAALGFVLSILFCLLHPAVATQVMTRATMGLAAMVISAAAFGSIGLAISAGSRSVRTATNTAAVVCMFVGVVGVPMLVAALSEAEKETMVYLTFVFPPAAVFLPSYEGDVQLQILRYVIMVAGAIIGLVVIWFSLATAADGYRARIWRDTERQAAR